jgi:hypothetical protein
MEVGEALDRIKSWLDYIINDDLAEPEDFEALDLLEVYYLNGDKR